MFDDPGDNIGPKPNDLWKPVIAAVNGMACGGAFYMLGEVEFIIAADHATFFDPHVTYGMTAALRADPHVAKMPFGEIMRHDRCSAAASGCRPSVRTRSGWSRRSAPSAELHERVEWAAREIATRLRSASRARCARSGRGAT